MQRPFNQARIRDLEAKDAVDVCCLRCGNQSRLRPLAIYRRVKAKAIAPALSPETALKDLPRHFRCALCSPAATAKREKIAVRVVSFDSPFSLFPVSLPLPLNPVLLRT